MPANRQAARLQHMATIADLWEAFAMRETSPARTPEEIDQALDLRRVWYAGASAVLDLMSELARLSEAEALATLETWQAEAAEFWESNGGKPT